MAVKITTELKGVVPDGNVAGFLRELQLRTSSCIGVPQGGNNIAMVIQGDEGVIRMPWGEIKVKCESPMPSAVPYQHGSSQEQLVILRLNSNSKYMHVVNPIVSDIESMIRKSGGYIPVYDPKPSALLPLQA